MFIDKVKELITVNSPNLSIDELRLIQREGGFILPSDYVYIALNFNNFTIEKEAYRKIKIDGYGSAVFDITQCVRDIKDEIPILEMYDESDGLNLKETYLPIIQTGSRSMFLIGITKDNLNQIYFFDPVYNDKTEMDYTLCFVADNIFDLINKNCFSN